VRTRAQEYNRLAVGWAHDHLAAERARTEAVSLSPEVVAARRAELGPKVAASGNDPRKLVDLIYAEALAQTDCEACGYPTCRDYAGGLLAGDPETNKCEPGGGRSQRDIELILELRLPGLSGIPGT
jgi:ArsR family metal-binding transcriptional regulator